MEENIFRRSIKSGVLTFLLTVAFSLISFLEPFRFFLIFIWLTPGFVFGHFLSLTKGDTFVAYLFIVISGIVHVLLCFIAGALAFSDDASVLGFPIASVCGAITLLICYKFLIDKSVRFWKGVAVLLPSSAIMALLPIAGMALQWRSNYDPFGILSTIVLNSGFMFWQIMFGFILKILQGTADKCIAKGSVAPTQTFN